MHVMIIHNHLIFTALNLKGNFPTVENGAPKTGKADCTMTMSDETFMDLSAGKLDGQKVSYTH